MINTKEKQTLEQFKKSAQLRKISREKRIQNIKTAGLWDSLKKLLPQQESQKPKSEEGRLQAIQKKLIDVSGPESTAERKAELGRQRLQRIRKLRSTSTPPPPPTYLPPSEDLPADEESSLTPETPVDEPKPRPTPEIPSIAPGRKPFRGEKRPTIESLTRKPPLSTKTPPQPITFSVPTQQEIMERFKELTGAPDIDPALFNENEGESEVEDDWLNAPEIPPQRQAHRKNRLKKLAKILG